MAYIPCNSGGVGNMIPPVGKAYVWESGSDGSQVTGQQVAFSIKDAPSFTLYSASDFGSSGCFANVNGYTNFKWQRTAGNGGGAVGLCQIDADGNIISQQNYLGQLAGPVTIALNALTKYVIFHTNIYYNPSGYNYTLTITLS